jgi:HlyD family secretion protein
MKRWSKYLWWVAGAALVGLLVMVALRPEVVAVDVATVTRGPMTVTIDEEGETRIRHRFLVSAPVGGRIDRIDLEPGDLVTAGRTVIARLRPETPPLLDARTRAETEASLDAARASLGRAQADELRAKTAVTLAQSELTRERELDRSGLTTRQAVELREANLRTAEEALRASTFAVGAAASDVQRIEARLRPDASDATGRLLPVTSPVSGVVLRRLRESAAVVPPGEPLVEVGDPADLEIVADLLSTDAVRVPPGAEVRLERWGGPDALAGRVRRVEPSGFMKVSALGVEEQRVNVIIDFVDPVAASARLGDGFRTDVRIVTWESPDVVRVPTGALFRRGEAWAVFVIDADTVRSVEVTLGERNSDWADVRAGLTEGDEVVLHPPDTLSAGTRVERRPG